MKPRTQSPSSLAKFLDCEQAYAYRYEERLSPLRQESRMQIGSLVHSGLEAAFRDWLRPKPDTFTAVRAAIEAYDLHDDSVDFDPVAMRSEALDISMYALKSSFSLEDWRPLLDPTGVPMIEYDVQYTWDNGQAMAGRLDLVAEHVPTGYAWLIDYKVRRSFQSHEAEEMSSQFAFYQYALSHIGVDLAGRVTLQIKPWVPRLPDITKKGEISRAANAKCTWDLYRQAVETIGGDIREYADMRAKLEKNEFARVTQTHVSLAEATRHVNNMRRALARVEQTEQPLRNIRSFSCPRCEYYPLCSSELRNGDTDYLKQTLYTVGENRKAHQIEVDLHDESDFEV